MLDRLNGVPARCDFAAGQLKGERGSGGGLAFLSGKRQGRSFCLTRQFPLDFTSAGKRFMFVLFTLNSAEIHRNTKI